MLKDAGVIAVPREKGGEYFISFRYSAVVYIREGFIFSRFMGDRVL